MLEREEFKIPDFTGKYIEPFLGGGAVFFHLEPERSILSDLNSNLIEVYAAIRENPKKIRDLLEGYHSRHNKEFYYSVRSKIPDKKFERAARFLYLNRSCWNGLYRENLKGEFNVPIGTKTQIISENESFEHISLLLKNSEIFCSDFEQSISKAVSGDLVFVDPPYTTAHNNNGFIKYNQKIFSWDDQIRLRNALINAAQRGAIVISTNANHKNVRELYSEVAKITPIARRTVISGSNIGRSKTEELLIQFV